MVIFSFFRALSAFLTFFINLIYTVAIYNQSCPHTVSDSVTEVSMIVYAAGMILPQRAYIKEKG
jgi:hypothetical protein